MINPKLSGAAGKGWSLAPGSQADGNAAHQACLAMWLVEQPGVHAFWSRWAISLIHLRDIPGVPSAVKNFSGATHEIQIFALDPNSYGEHEHLPARVRWAFLSPADLVHQFEVSSDAEAVKLTELLVRAFCDGYLAADADFASRNAKAIDQTAKHFREGRHALA